MRFAARATSSIKVWLTKVAFAATAIPLRLCSGCAHNQGA
jgi:hypothetical protein